MYNKIKLASEGYIPAQWRYKDEATGRYILGDIYMNPRINNVLSKLYVNTKGEFVIADWDGGLTPAIPIGNSSGYLSIKVRDNPDYDTGMGLYLIHRIMCYTYYGLPPVGKDTVEHINNRRNDNSIENLCWMSERENKAGRQFGSKASIEEKRIGRDAKYDKRDTEKIRRRKNIQQDMNNYADYLAEIDEFLDNYR